MGAPDFSKGDLVTVTYDDGTRVRTWHGRFDGHIPVVTVDYGIGAARLRGRWAHVPMTSLVTAEEGARLNPGEDLTDWIRLGKATVRDFDRQDLSDDARNWVFDNIFSLMFRADLTGLTITPITAEGQAYVHKYEDPQRTRERLIARFAEFDAAAAAELDSVIERLDERAYERGQDSARDSYYN